MNRKRTYIYAYKICFEVELAGKEYVLKLAYAVLT